MIDYFWIVRYYFFDVCDNFGVFFCKVYFCFFLFWLGWVEELYICEGFFFVFFGLVGEYFNLVDCIM